LPDDRLIGGLVFYRRLWGKEAINGTRYINCGARSAKKADLVPALG
jgi:hypothetical protein